MVEKIFSSCMFNVLEIGADYKFDEVSWIFVEIYKSHLIVKSCTLVGLIFIRELVYVELPSFKRFSRCFC